MSEKEKALTDQEPTPGDGGAVGGSEQSIAHPLEKELDSYPLRPPEEDPKWSVRFFKAWFCILVASLGFLFFLIVSSFLVE